MKKCSVCGLDKDDVGKNGKCKRCNTDYMRQYREKNRDKIKKYQQKYDAQYYEENKGRILSNKKEYYQDNKEDILDDRKEYYQDNRDEKLEYNREYYLANRDHIIENAKTYAINHPEWLKEYHSRYCKERRANDPNFRIRAAVSANINYYLKSNASSKNGASCLDYLPYSIDELKEHLEKQFEPWMNWQNYGRYDAVIWKDSDPTTWTWQIDHIIPQSTFHYTSMGDEEFRKCWALTNLRPLSAKQNFLEGVNRVRHIK